MPSTGKIRRVDCRLLNIQKDDVILTITSAGDNILDYLLEGPRRVHAVDLNPNQNHLLELKVAAFSALSLYRYLETLSAKAAMKTSAVCSSTKLSPYMSGHALQHWLNHTRCLHLRPRPLRKRRIGARGKGRPVAVQAFWVDLQAVRTFCSVETLNEQTRDVASNPESAYELATALGSDPYSSGGHGKLVVCHQHSDS